MAGEPLTTSAARDYALQLLRDLTIACVLGATALLGAFTLIAAVTIPGQNNNSGSTAPSLSADGNQEQSDDNQLQAPSRGQFGPGSGTPVVVTGGSR